jgi:large subunit ribosomal protein L17
MRHGIAGRKFSRTTNQRKALLRSLCEALIINGSIVTTLPKAKSLRPILEKVITKSLPNTLSTYRDLLSRFDPKCCAIVRDRLVPACKGRPGGYLRIVKAGFRSGDNAPMAVIAFVDEAAFPPEKQLDRLNQIRQESQKNLEEARS